MLKLTTFILLTFTATYTLINIILYVAYNLE